MKAISLFSGAGGDTLGLERAGYTVVAYSENNQHAIATHQAAFPHSILLKDPVTGSTDIRKIPDEVFATYTGQIQVLFAGFPCQGFSHAGKKRADDPRNELVHEFARVARIVKPAWIIGENVRGLLSRLGRDPADPPTAPNKPVIDILRRVFADAGYNISYHVIDATEVGVPQLRKRLIIVGLRSTQFYPHIDWPARVPSEPVPTVRSFLETHLNGATSLNVHCADPDRFLIPTTVTVATGTPHPNLQRLATGLRNRSSKEKAEDPQNTTVSVIEPDGLISFGRRKSGYHGEVVDPDGPSKTIICTYNLCPRLFVGLRDPTGHSWVRCLSVRELAQIQGFPADYPWQGDEKAQIIQIGNAVPPPLATKIGLALQRVWSRPFPQTDEDPSLAADADSDDDTEA
jgi:DNA (cytosine-5)-methyltransferase 1